MNLFSVECVPYGATRAETRLYHSTTGRQKPSNFLSRPVRSDKKVFVRLRCRCCCKKPWILHTERDTVGEADVKDVPIKLPHSRNAPRSLKVMTGHTKTSPEALALQHASSAAVHRPTSVQQRHLPGTKTANLSQLQTPSVTGQGRSLSYQYQI